MNKAEKCFGEEALMSQIVEFSIICFNCSDYDCSNAVDNDQIVEVEVTYGVENE